MRTVLRLVTPPTERAVTVNEARRHLRLDHMDDDDIVVAYLQAAEQSLAYVGRALKPASYALDIYGYPHPCIEIPMPPLRSVSAVRVVGSSGALAVWDPANYVVTTTSEGRGQLRLASIAIQWPYYSSGYITASVEFSAGYNTVPAALRSAILLIAGALYENRSAASPIPMTKLPHGVDGLVSVYREQFM